MQQNEKIIAVNNQFKAKNEEIETQKEEIESSRDLLEKAFNNITLLSEFGQKLTSTFDFDAINKMIYEYVSSLMDTAAFGKGIYNEKRKIIDFPYFIENGKPVPYFIKSLKTKKTCQSDVLKTLKKSRLMICLSIIKRTLANCLKYRPPNYQHLSSIYLWLLKTSQLGP